MVVCLVLHYFFITEYYLESYGLMIIQMSFFKINYISFII